MVQVVTDVEAKRLIELALRFAAPEDRRRAPADIDLRTALYLWFPHVVFAARTLFGPLNPIVVVAEYGEPDHETALCVWRTAATLSDETIDQMIGAIETQRSLWEIADAGGEC